MSVLRFVAVSDIIEYLALLNVYNQGIEGVTCWKDSLPEENPVAFATILHQLGINIKKPIETQEGFTFRDRNGKGKQVACTRWVGSERTDKEWIESGVASREVKHLASGNRLIADMLGFNRMKEELVQKTTPADFAVPEEEQNK